MSHSAAQLDNEAKEASNPERCPGKAPKSVIVIDSKVSRKSVACLQNFQRILKTMPLFFHVVFIMYSLELVS